MTDPGQGFGPPSLTPSQTGKLLQQTGSGLSGSGSPGSGGGGSGSGGGSAGGILSNPAYWANLAQQNKVQQGLYGTQEDLARQGFSDVSKYGWQGYGLTKEEAAARSENIKKMMGLLKDRLYGQWGDIAQQERESAIERSARGSALDYATLSGREIAKTEAGRKTAEAQTDSDLKQRLLDIGVQQARVGLQQNLAAAKLDLSQQLARLQAETKLAELDYQNQLLRKP